MFWSRQGRRMVLLKLSKEGKATHDTDMRAEQCCSVPGFVFLIPPKKKKTNQDTTKQQKGLAVP